MSSPDRGSPQKSQRNDVCRDFLNKICNRSRCKFYHPPDEELRSYDKKFSSGDKSAQQAEYHFCYEYQTSSEGCMRPTCRYLHCNQTSSEHYAKSGKIDLEMAKAIVALNPGMSEVDDRPLCKEFLNNKCRRGDSCRFWHINPIYEQQQRMGIGKQAKAAGARYYNNRDVQYGPRSPNDAQFNDTKRQKYGSYDYGPSGMQSPYNPSVVGSNQFAQIYNSPQTVYSNPTQVRLRESIDDSSLKSILLAENAELQRTYELLLKTVNDLRASNESLLSENAALRATWQHVTGHAVAANQSSASDAGGLVDQGQSLGSLLPTMVYYK